MLSPEYMERVTDHLIVLYQGLEDDILKDIADRIKKNGYLTATAERQAEVLIESGYTTDEIESLLKPHFEDIDEEITQIINKSGLKHYEDEAKAYRVVNKNLIDLTQNKHAENTINNAVDRLIKGNANITQSLGVVCNGENVKLNKFYKDKLNQAAFKVASGAFSGQQVVRGLVNDLSESGIRVINYQNSGRNYTVESAAKMLVRTTINQMTGEISLSNAEDMGQDLMEISAHAGARPSHAEWQGQIVSLSGDNDKYLSLDDIGYGDVAGFMGANCRHNWYPFFEGISERAWSQEMLDNIDPEPFEFEDKEYTYYEATQKQRQIERTIRKYKHRVMMYDKVGDDESKLIAQVRLQRQRQLYKDFNKAGKLRPTTVNTNVYGYSKNKYFEELKQSNRYKIYKERISGTYWNNATFASEKLRNKHIDKHLKEFDNLSEEEYLQKARDLLNAELSDNIKGFMTQQKFIFKYNIKNNEFAIGSSKGFISTYFKPKPGIKYWEGETKKYEIFK
ncbi:phage minor capsid protein [Anaerococcus sp. Marseille-P3915]|uniref:phage minor capsid protein n=1 Tax=Anaerococcus sp. Marseille-P3915 TaxID=2057799 RepID=UPI000D0BDEFC|nr:phage minor capsid protein [Anaerococcus sp. Marseille-P3915]